MLPFVFLAVGLVLLVLDAVGLRQHSLSLDLEIGSMLLGAKVHFFAIITASHTRVVLCHGTSQRVH